MEDATMLRKVLAQLIDDQIGDNDGLYILDGQGDDTLVNANVYTLVGAAKNTFMIELTPQEGEEWPFGVGTDEVKYKITVEREA